ncbi:MAG TPA: NAD(P)/FAD-dependent oxidoreductase [Candidatus Limnocylindria bacterium]|nr:NAD(P)/FAD-dependent oxidoreductase [Candidatus Limnocylindria bacterium]
MEHFDVIVVGAGLSGIGMAYHLQERCPSKSYVILEGRAQSGGTWDLFRYPGIRSDSDMFTLGYRFKPWEARKAIADGPSILAYIRETAREHGIEPHVRYSHRVRHAAWSSADARWQVVAERPDGQRVTFTCNFLSMCAGYYDYDQGYTPEFPGRAAFRGRIVHPQQWTDDIDYAGKRVVVIGSGATAVTLVPELAKQAAHVVMLQRSPTYMISRPAEDRLAEALRKVLPSRLAYWLTRWKNVFLHMLFFRLARRYPERTAERMIAMVRDAVGPSVDVPTHFTPRYKPWDQRVCLVPDDDLFVAIRKGRVSVVTDHIETFTEAGIRLRSGQELRADLIVTATGLKVQFAGGATIVVDGTPVEPGRLMNYRGCMFSDVPNFAVAFGYTNASWTLKADLTAEFVCRILKRMDALGARQVTPRRRDPDLGEEPFVDFSSGYIQRAIAQMPKQGTKHPWRLYQNYIRDIFTLRYGSIDDPCLEFSSPATAAAEPPDAAVA